MATNENLIPIPGRLHSVATEGHVAGADEIIDDNLSKDQQTINAEVNAALGEGGTVDEKIAEAIDNALEDVAFIDDSESSPAVVPGFDPTTDTVHVTAQTLSEQQKVQVRTNIGLNDVDAKIAAEASARQAGDQATISAVNSAISAQNTRISQQDSTINARFSEQDEKMDNMQATINEKQLEIGAVETDLEPIEHSPNRLTSGTLYDVYGGYIENPEYIEALTDGEGKIIEGWKINGTKIINVDLEVDGDFSSKKVSTQIVETEKEDISGNVIEVIDNPEFVELTTDKHGRILHGSTSNGDYVACGVSVKKLREDLDNVSPEKIKESLVLEDVKSGTPNIYLKTSDVVGNVSLHGGSYDPVNDCINFLNPSAGNYWIYSLEFNPNGEKLVHIKFEIKDTAYPIKVCISKNTTDSPFVLQTISADGKYDVTFDPTYYRIYEGFINSFYVWFYAEGVIANAKICNIQVFDNIGLNTGVIDGSNAEELFESTDSNLANIKAELASPAMAVSPDGTKFEIGVDNSGNVVTKRVIPNKVAFIGNSLLQGNNNGTVPRFGMTALEPSEDFASKTIAYISSINPDFDSYLRIDVGEFEVISNLSDIDAVIQNTIINNLPSDTELVVVEAGDNVSETNVANILPTSSDRLLKAIKYKCPNARVCWVGVWYNSVKKFNAIEASCKKNGCTLIPIYDLYTPEYTGTIGDIIDYGEVGNVTWTIENVSNLVDNGGGNITFTFTFLWVTKTITINVSEYTYNNNILNYKGRYQVITVGYSHPGNKGMSEIANRLLYSMGISSENRIYN